MREFEDSLTDMFSPDEFNLHFTSAAAGSGSDEVFDGFAFSCVEEAVVLSAIMGIKSVAVGAEDFSIKLIRIVLPHILSVLTHLFNFVISSSSFLTEFRAPTSLADFHPIIILPVLSQGIERILCDQFVEYIESCGFLSRFQSGFREFPTTATATAGQRVGMSSPPGK
jgi:hypothetical protein